MKRNIWILVVAIMVLAQAGIAYADNIGTVDMARIFSSYSEAKKSEENFRKRNEDLRKEFEKRQKTIDEAKEKHKSEKEIRSLIEKLEKELEPKQKELADYHTQLMTQLRQEIRTAIKGAARQYGIDVVLDSQAVLDGGFDLTDFVLQRLNGKK